MGLIDADKLVEGLKLHYQGTDQEHESDRQWAIGYNAGLERAFYSIAYAHTEPDERLRELMQAEADGRLVVLPQIPKYKTLYWLWGDEIMPVRYWGLRGGCVDRDGKYHATCEMRTKKDRTFCHMRNRKPQEYTFKAGDRRFFYVDDIGKTVFFTRSEAEAAITAKEV